MGVITGGGSVMPGMTALCQDILGLKDVRKGTVRRDLITCGDEFFAPSYSTALSLVIYAMERASEETLYGNKPYRGGNSAMDKLSNFFRGIFG